MAQVIRQRVPAAEVSAADRDAAIALPLDFDARRRSRQRICSGHLDIALALAAGESLHEGDLLIADDGARFRVLARAQRVLRARSADPWLLARAAYHLGNRHTAVAVLRDELRLEPDPVLSMMLERLGLEVTEEEAPFEPEAGAYGGGHRHGHDATFAEDYALAQAVFVRHDRPPPPG